jgi:hypothetical protein
LCGFRKWLHSLLLHSTEICVQSIPNGIQWLISFSHIAYNEDEGKNTHKNEVSKEDNIKHNDGNITTVIDEEIGQLLTKTKWVQMMMTLLLQMMMWSDLRLTRKSLIHPKENQPKNEERRMIGKSVDLLIISCMKNHVYKFGFYLHQAWRRVPNL